MLPFKTTAPHVVLLSRFATNLGVHPRTLHRDVARGRLLTVLIGARRFVTALEIERYLQPAPTATTPTDAAEPAQTSEVTEAAV